MTEASIKALFSRKPMYFLSLIIAFSWEPSVLHSVDTRSSKFSWISVSIPSNLTECSDVIFLSPLPETYQGLQSWSYPSTIESQFLLYLESFF